MHDRTCKSVGLQVVWWTVHIVWASSSGQTQDACATSTFSFFFQLCLSIVHNEQATKKQKTDREGRAKIEPRSMQNRPKINQNRRKYDLGQLWALKIVSGSCRDALGTHSGCPKTMSGPILGRQRQAKCGRETSKIVLGEVRRRSQTTLEPWLSVGRVSSTITRSFWTIFRILRLVAQKREVQNSCAHAVFCKGRRATPEQGHGR